MKSKLRTVILDDDIEDARVMRRWLGQISGFDCDVTHVDSMAQLAPAMTDAPPDLLFIDNYLSGESGLDAIVDVRKVWSDVPIVMMTGQGNEELAKEAIRRGATDYISKGSLNADSLRIVIESALREFSVRQERAEVEARLRKQERLDSVTLLASHLAHDYNNLLSAILGYTELCIDQIEPESSLRADLEEVRSAALRARDLTLQLLTISRMRVVQAEVISLHAEVRQITDKLTHAYGNDYVFRLDSAAQHDVIQANPAQLSQLIDALVAYSCDLSPDGCSFDIRTDTLYLDQREADRLQVCPGEYVTLEIADNGPGIPEPLREHIFEPFYESVIEGVNSGMGLALAYGIARQHDGTIDAVSEIGKGARFVVYFPAYIEEEPCARPPQHAPPANQVDSAPLVMVVDDEPLLCKIIQRTLEPIGYRVVTATAPVEAVQRCEEQQLEPDLLITDVVMPDMSGREVYQRLRDRQPKLRVLFVSGFTRGLVEREGMVDQGAAFMQKPFSLGALTAYVRLLLPLPVTGEVQ